jgi:hypothetical protein
LRRDKVIVAVALVAGGLLTCAVLIPRYVAGAPLSGGLSPAFMPYVAAGLATLSGLGVLLEGMRKSDASADNSRLTRANLRFLGASAAVFGASYVLMALFGYVIGGVVLMAGLLKLARVKPVRIAIAAVAAPIALWLFFVGLLAMPLP